MNKKKIVLVIGIVTTLVLLGITFALLNHLNKKPITSPADRFIQAIVGEEDESLYTESYIKYLKQQEDNLAIDPQGFDSAYSNYSTTIKYTGVSNIVITGDTATCEVTAVETTTNTDTGQKTISNQRYKLELKLINDEWKINGADLVSSTTR